MIAEVGHFSLILGLLLALVQAVFPWLGLSRGNPVFFRIADRAAIGQFAFVFGAFLALTTLHMVSDFSVLNVVQNSHTTKPLLYKISGVWGNHEGSMLLWVLVLAAYGMFLARPSKKMPQGLRVRALAVQGLIGFSFIAFLVLTSNPFARVFPPPLDGQDLNPLLQDPGLAFHPPLLYFGYVGLSTAFSLAAAGLLEGKIDAIWARATRRWVMVSWCFLTLGIAGGSWWAYNELGWGGFWFWDPVENASLMPWLFATALFHSIRVVEKREALRTWTALLAILAFSFSLIGTFLVRSGILTSVHAFAVDPTRGVFLLGLLALAIGGALVLFAIRAPALKPKGTFGPISREAMIMYNNLFLVSAGLLIFFGTFYPLFVEAMTGDKISVGAPFFNMTVIPIVLPALILVGVVARVPWKTGDPKGIFYELRYALALAVVAGALAAVFVWPGPGVAVLGVILAAWMAGGTVLDLVLKLRKRGPGRGLWARLAGLPRATWGMAVAHFGMAVLVLAITGVSFGSTEAIQLMRPGDTIAAGGTTLKLERVYVANEKNYQALRGEFSVWKGGRNVDTLVSEKRFYPVRETETTEAGIRSSWWGDLYLSLGQQAGEDALPVHFFKKPLIPWMWFSAVLLVIGGGLSLAGGKREGGPDAPKGKRTKRGPAK
jgi:cytochrome c-type biogenesis protein CcmF